MDIKELMQTMRFKLDIRRGLTVTPMPHILMKGDRNANRIIVELTDDGQPIDLTGVEVSGKFIRPPDGAEILLTGEANGSEAIVQLIDQCYQNSGTYEADVALTLSGVRRTILSITGRVHYGGGGALVDVSGVVPSIDDIIAQYAEMKRITEETGRTLESAKEALETAQDATATAQGWANATATAVDVGPDEDPAVEMTTGEDGAKHLTFYLKQGEKGDPGEPGPKGDGKLDSVNGIAPEEGSTNITLTAEDVGAVATGNGTEQTKLLLSPTSVSVGTTSDKMLTLNDVLTNYETFSGKAANAAAAPTSLNSQYVMDMVSTKMTSGELTITMVRVKGANGSRKVNVTLALEFTYSKANGTLNIASLSSVNIGPIYGTKLV